MLKDVLCVVEPGDDASASLLQALALSQGYGATTQFVAAAPAPPPVTNFFGSDLVASLIKSAKIEAADTAQKVSDRIVECASRYGINANVTQESRSLAEIAVHVREAAKTYDLTLIERPDSFLDSSAAIFETVLFESGRPVLLASPATKPVERFKRAVLGWDGSVPATRAIASMLSLFPGLEEIFVLTVVNEKDLSGTVPGADIAAHIRRHGIQVTVASVDVESADGNPGQAIIDFATNQRADLLVMGGYGKSRFREFVLGGVTEYLSKATPVPLLLVH